MARETGEEKYPGLVDSDGGALEPVVGFIRLQPPQGTEHWAEHWSRAQAVTIAVNNMVKHVNYYFFEISKKYHNFLKYSGCKEP